MVTWWYRSWTGECDMVTWLNRSWTGKHLHLHLHKYCEGFHITVRNYVISSAFQTCVLTRVHIFRLCQGLDLVIYCFPHDGLSCCETTLLECMPLQFCDHLCHTLMSSISTCDKSGTTSLYLFQVVDITLLMWVPRSTRVLSNWSDVSSICRHGHMIKQKLDW